VAGTGLGDRALAALGVRRALGGHDPQEARQQTGPWEPPPVANVACEQASANS
jgi:hypothetical protein